MAAQHKLLWALLFLHCEAQAQYLGGSGRGDAAVIYFPTPVASNIFSGGNGRGDVAASHTPTPVASNIFSGGNGRGDVAVLHTPAPVASNIFLGGVGRGDVAVAFIPPSLNVLIALRGFLEGPYNASTGSMSDALRTLPSFPLNEPYTALGYAYVGTSGGSVAPAVLATTGNNAIVDWVVVELRDASSPTTIIASRSALIQRDGDVVSTDGVSPLIFDHSGGNFYVALRHRNHLGIMTQSPVALSSSPTGVDFSVASTLTYGTNARKSITGTFATLALWAGDVTFNGALKYAGSGNDRDPILVRIGGTVPTATASGYLQEDVNMNGQVKYAGSANDRDPILVNIGGSVPTSTRLAQLP